MVMVNIGLGTSVLVGGQDRFTFPTYQPLITYSFGHIWLWGVAILIAAFLMATPFRWFNIVGLWISMCWHIVWMAAFTSALLRYEDAAATPIPAYGGLAMISAALLTARVIDRAKE